MSQSRAKDRHQEAHVDETEEMFPHGGVCDLEDGITELERREESGEFRHFREIGSGYPDKVRVGLEKRGQPPRQK